MKPIRPLSELRAFRRAIDNYTGLSAMKTPIRPVQRLVPSPLGEVIRALGL